jgi:hypothetical protein
MHHLHRSLLQLLLNLFVETPHRSLTRYSKGWPGEGHYSRVNCRSNDCYLALTVHFINDECELCSFLLECFKYNERHTVENLAAETKRLLTEWSVYNEVVALVTDNAANMGATTGLGGWKHLPCFAHSINLIVQAGLKEVQQTHVKGNC